MFTSKNETPSKATHSSDELRDGVHTLKRDIRDAASVLRSDMDDIAKTAGKQARKMVNEAEDNVVDVADTLSERIRENPVQATAIALGVGLILGLLTRRR